jgi:hypothetical protein
MVIDRRLSVKPKVPANSREMKQLAGENPKAAV